MALPGRLRSVAGLWLVALALAAHLAAAQNNSSYLAPGTADLQDVLETAGKQAAAAESQRVREVTAQAAAAHSGGLVASEAFVANLTTASVRLREIYILPLRFACLPQPANHVQCRGVPAGAYQAMEHLSGFSNQKTRTTKPLQLRLHAILQSTSAKEGSRMPPCICTCKSASSKQGGENASRQTS